jgi:hypothetical protein
MEKRSGYRWALKGSITSRGEEEIGFIYGDINENGRSEIRELRGPKG